MRKNRRFAVGDIHGCIRTFRYLTEEVLKIGKGDTLFLLGDYIDRGPGSREVIDYIRHLATFASVRPVMGNHEYMLLKTMKKDEFFPVWWMNGCEATLISFGAYPIGIDVRDTLRSIPAEYVEFFRTLPLYEQTDEFVFVHAGIQAESEYPLENTETLLWTRSEEFSPEFLGNRKLIHGHTPVELSQIEKRVADPGSKVINLDGGCVYHYPGMGYLVALDLDGMRLYPVKNRE